MIRFYKKKQCKTGLATDRKMGMNLTTAITIFCTKVAQERRIPFEITADPAPFYSESNIRYLEKKMEDYKAGRLKLAEHELIEE